MADPLHSIQIERLDVEIANEALAVALQPRIGDLNRQRLLPVIERVFGEVDSPDRHIRIDRLVVDLGVLPVAGLEDAAEAALYEGLHRALRDALDGAWAAGVSPAGVPPADALIALLAHYLEHGTLPFWAASVGMPRGGFSAQSLVRALTEDDPVGLVALLRRIGRAPQVLERLVLQLDEAALQSLLRLIEPEHAALILAYMLDLRLVHRAEPILSLDDAGFERLLWTLTLSYLLRDAGSQFNRKSFVAAILEGASRGEGLDYRTLVATLARGLQATLRHLPLASSLPAVIAEIARDLGAAPSDVAAADTAMHDASVADDPSAIAALIRRHGGDRALLDRLVARLDDATLQAVLRLLEPVHAALVITYLLDLRRVHHTSPLLARGEAAFRHLLWVLTLSYFSREAGSQFNRKSFMRALLDGIASGEGLDYETLLTTLARALRVTAERQPLASSLPAVIEELAREMPPPASVSGDDAAIAERYVRLDALRHYLRHGVLPVDVLLHRPEWTVESLLADLSKLSLAQLRALLTGANPAALLNVVQALPPGALAMLLQQLLPAAAGLDSPLQTAIAAAAETAPHRDIFHARLIAALIDGTELDLEAMAAASPEPSLSQGASDDPAAWPAPRLAAALLARTRADDADGLDWVLLLDTLLSRHPAEAKSFLHAVAASPEGDALLTRVPARFFGRILALMRPAEAQAIEFMLTAIAQLPMSERPGSDAAMRRAALSVMLRFAASPGPPILERVLRAVFDGVPQASTSDRLMRLFERADLPEVTQAALVAAHAAAREPKAAAQEDARLAGLREALFDWLRGADSGRAEPVALDVLLAALPEIVAAFPDELRAFLPQYASRPDLRARWAERLPESTLARLIVAAEPRQARIFLDNAELLHAAAAEVALARHEPTPSRAAMWNALLGYLAATPPAERTSEGLLTAVLTQSVGNEEPLREAATRLAQAAGRQSLVAALTRTRDMRPAGKALAQLPKQSPRVRPARGRTAFGMGEAEAPDSEPIYIDNAGLVLAGAFLPHLFRTLDLLAQDESGRTHLRDNDAASRAVHLLQYLVDGRCSAPEPLLALNKVMCGLPTSAPVLREIEPADRERELCDSLLGAMISRWEIIQKSSVAALRETFLRRNGRLMRKGEGWDLRVERKTVDVLVDRVPWNVALIFNAWMPEPLHVTW